MPPSKTSVTWLLRHRHAWLETLQHMSGELLEWTMLSSSVHCVLPCARYVRCVTARLLTSAVVSALVNFPLSQAKRGALKDCPADDMLAAVLQATVDRTGVEPEVSDTSCRGVQGALLQASTMSASSLSSTRQ